MNRTLHCREDTNSKVTQVNPWTSFRHHENANDLCTPTQKAMGTVEKAASQINSENCMVHSAKGT